MSEEAAAAPGAAGWAVPAAAVTTAAVWADSWGGGAVDGGSFNSFLAAALTRAMRAAVPIPDVASASVLHSVPVGGSVIGVVRPL